MNDSLFNDIGYDVIKKVPHPTATANTTQNALTPDSPSGSHNQNGNSNNGGNKVLNIFLLILATAGTAGCIGYFMGIKNRKIKYD